MSKQKSIISQLLDMTVPSQVNVHPNHISVGSNFSIKLSETTFGVSSFRQMKKTKK